jgi:hypothetical protein
VIKGWVSVFALAVLAGCATVPSKNLRTAGITAQMTVAAADGGVDVRVRLSAGSLTSVKLGDGEHLDATSGGHSARLSGTTFLGTTSYFAHVPSGTAPGTPVTVALTRTAKDTSAPRSTVALPPRLRVTAPRDGASMSRARDLRIVVNRGDGGIRVAWQGSCVASGFGTEFAAGQPVVVPAGSLHATSASSAASGSAAATSCLVTFTVTRFVAGALDPALGGGRIRGERSVSFALTSRP